MKIQGYYDRPCPYCDCLPGPSDIDQDYFPGRIALVVECPGCETVWWFELTETTEGLALK